VLATVHSRAQFGMQAPPVTIDVHAGPGLPTLTVVGLAEGAVRAAAAAPPSSATAAASPVRCSIASTSMSTFSRPISRPYSMHIM